MDRPAVDPHRNEPQASPPGRRGLWLALLVASILRLYHLGTQSLWVDEIFTWQTASPTAPLTWIDLVSNLHGPLVSAFAHFWMLAFGDSEFVAAPAHGARLDRCSCPSWPRWRGRLAGPAAFLPAAWLVALSPFVTWYGQEFRGYVVAMLFAALALLGAAARGATAAGAATSRLLVAWTVLGAWSNMSGVLLVPVFAGALLRRAAAGARALRRAARLPRPGRARAVAVDRLPPGAAHGLARVGAPRARAARPRPPASPCAGT